MKNRISGFSLLEMSIVVLISGIIMTSILNVIPMVYKSTKLSLNTKKLEKVEDAFYAFIAKNKRLPRPANIEDKLSTDISTFGKEQSETNNIRKVDSNNNLYIGTLPAVDLGLSPEYVYDEFGSKLIYVVDEDCTKTRGLIECTNNDNNLIVMDTNGVRTKGIIFSIIAQGYNKKYSYATNSTKQSTTKYLSKAEMNNSYDFFNGIVYNRVYNNKSFDDTVIYGTKNFIMSKLNMYDIGCSVNMNNAEIVNSIAANCNGSPSFSENGIKSLNYRETVESLEYEFNSMNHICVIECGSYGKTNIYSYTYNDN